MENEQDIDPATQETQPETPEATRETQPAPEAEAQADAAPEADPDAIDPAYYEQITNPHVTAEERDKVARAMMETDQISRDTMTMGAQMGAGMGLMELIKQFMGITDSFADLQDMTRGVFEAFDKGLVTEEGKLNEGVVQPLLDDAQRMAPPQPAPQGPNTAPQQDPSAMTPPGMGMS